MNFDKNIQTRIINELKRLNLLFFTVNDISKIINKNKNQIYHILLQLKKKGWIKMVEKGKYLLTGFDSIEKFHPFFIATHVTEPSYVSFWSALQFYGFTEQLPRTVFVATTTSKKELKLKSFDIKFVRLDKKRFFGYKKIIMEEQEVFIAEKEKCIVDSLFQLRYCGGLTEAYKALKNTQEYDINKLLDYASKMGSNSLLRRIGFLLELCNIDMHKKLQNLLGKGYIPLDPDLRKEGRLNKKWRVIENRKRWD